MANVLITGTSGRSGTMSDVFDKSRLNPVGTVRQSILSESQFQSKAGTGWVLADGRLVSILGSQDLYSAITSTYGSGTFFGSGSLSGDPAFRIPDMRNRYSRMSGTYSLGSCQSNTTHVGGLSVVQGDYRTEVNNAGVWNNTFGQIRSNPPGHYHGSGDLSMGFRFRNNHLYWIPHSCYLATYTADTYIQPFAAYTNTEGAFSGQGMALTGLTGPSLDLSGTSSISTTTTSVYISAGDPETRPETVVLNWFIKIK